MRRCDSLNEYQIEAFVEDLGGYSEEALAEVWKEVRRTSSNVAHFVTAIKERGEKTPVGISSPANRSEKICQFNTTLADQVMRSPVGREALRQGVGHAVWMAAFRDGKTCTEADIRDFQQHMRDAVDGIVTYPEQGSPLYKRLIGLHDAMTQREKDLSRRYLRAD